MPPATARRYRFATYRLDTRSRELREGDGAPVPLTAKAFDTLRTSSSTATTWSRATNCWVRCGPGAWSRKTR